VVQRALRHRVDALLQPHNPVYEFLDRRALRRMAREHLVGRRDHSPALWRALVLQLWMAHLEAARWLVPFHGR